MQSYSDHLAIDTPENILLSAEIAGFGSRFMAALMDYILIALLLVGITWLFTQARPSGISGSADWFPAVYYIVIFLITWGYHLIFELLWNGQTPGKRRAGIRVIQSNGLPVTVSALLIRNIIRLFDFLPMLYGLGLVMLFATRRTQRLGDMAARTVVIREHRHVTVQTIKEDMRIHYLHVKPTDPIPSFIQIELLTEDDRYRVVDYLRRRGKIVNSDNIANVLARKLSVKLEIERRYTGNADRLLEQIARAFELADHLRDEDR
ncbi:MAG: RDD family protein [Anaerolineaceae bacterium]|nr:RDD family protein [Anaerolineaceae bacterium]